MTIKYEIHESSQSQKPKNLDSVSSSTAVYIRKNIKRITKNDNISGEEYDVWQYEEATVTHEQFEEMLANQVESMTPYTETKTAYILDTEVTFENVPAGNLTVYIKDSEDNYPNYTIERIQDRVTVHFDPLEYVTKVTISIL